MLDVQDLEPARLGDEQQGEELQRLRLGIAAAYCAATFSSISYPFNSVNTIATLNMHN